MADIIYKNALPDASLGDFIQHFWSVRNPGDTDMTVSILPDGYFDLMFHAIGDQSFNVLFSGLWTKEISYVIPPNSFTIGISFKLLAVDYLFKHSIASLVDHEGPLPGSLWDISLTDRDFDHFVQHASERIRSVINMDIDPRKQQLFSILYHSNGTESVESISQATHWSKRQISRYFKNRFGLSLKAYSNILRYRASFQQLKEQQLYPEQDYADQAHFIRDVKKYSGVTPKKLAENKNGRFIQLSTLPQP